MSKPKLWDLWKIDGNTKQVWIDRNRLNWEVDWSFADILGKAIEDGKKIKLTDVKPSRWFKLTPMVDWVYHTKFTSKDENFSKTDRYKTIYKDFQISKLKKKQDKEIVDNFVDNTLIPKLQEAYNNWDANKKIIYDEKKEIMWALDRTKIKPWDIVTGVVERWIDSSKQYRVLVWKKWDSFAWSFVNDPEEERLVSTWDIIYFISDLNSAKKNILREYLPKEWDLKIWNTLSIVNLYDDGKSDYLSIKIGQYTWVLYKRFLPRWYTSEQKLMLKIKDILKKDGHLILKFDENAVSFDQEKEIKSNNVNQKEDKIDLDLSQKKKIA